MSNDKRSFTEELWVSGHELKETITRLVAEGNVRHLIVRNEHGDKLVEIPLTGGVVVGGAMVLLAPFLAAIAAVAAIATKVKIEVVREDPPTK